MNTYNIYIVHLCNASHNDTYVPKYYAPMVRAGSYTYMYIPLEHGLYTTMYIKLHTGTCTCIQPFPCTSKLSEASPYEWTEKYALCM